MSTLEKICRLPWYCEMFTARHVKSVISFSGSDWYKICTNLKKEYKDLDLTQQVSSRAYLEAFKDKPRTDNSEVLQFCRDYAEISKELIEKGKLDKYTQLRWFLQGLPLSIQSNLFNHYNIDLEGDAIPNFESILQKAYSLIETRKKMAELGTTDVKNDRMSDLVDRSAKKTQLGHPFSGPSTFLDLIFQISIIPTARLVASTPSQNNKKIDNFTDMMQNLALLVCTLQEDIGPSSIVAQPGPQPPKLSSELHMRTDYQGADPKKDWPEGTNKCMYCWSTNYYLKHYCQVFQDDLNSNRIHLGNKGKVCLGPYSSGTRPVFIRQEKSGRKSVAEAKKL